MAQSRTSVATPDDEISLVELWQIIARRKALSVTVFLVFVVAGAAYAFLKSPVYEAQVKLRIGQTNGTLLEAAEDLSSQLMSRYGERVADGVTRELPFLKRAAPQKDVASSVDLVAEGDSPAQSVELLSRIVDETRDQHDVVFDQNTTLLARRVASLEQQAVALRQQFSEATKLLRQLEHRDPVQASLLMIERGQLSSAMRIVDQDRFSVTQQLTPPQTRRTVLLGEIVPPIQPSAPSRRGILLWFSVIGAIAAVATTLVWEFSLRALTRR